MATTIKIIIRDIKSKPGKGVLVLRIIRHRVVRKITTPYVLSIDEWSEKLQKTVCSKKTFPTRKKELEEIDEKLQQDVALLLNTANMLESRDDYSSQELVDYFHRLKEGQLFCAYIEQVVKETKGKAQFGTAESYMYAGGSFRKFLGGSDIRIDKINRELMKRYEKFLESEHKSQNTISCYMRSLRSLYNRALKDKVFIVDENMSKPFSDVFTGNAKIPKRATGMDEISRLMKLELKEDKRELNEGKNKAPKGGGSVKTAGAAKTVELAEAEKREQPLSLSMSCDMFLFCFFAQGMAFVDAANLKKENIRAGSIRYYRKKTNQQITVRLEDRMKVIIERYADPDSDYIFPVLRPYQDCGEWVKWKKSVTLLSVHNKNLAILGDMAGIEQHLTSYVARHSWTSIALEEGVSIAAISKV